MCKVKCIYLNIKRRENIMNDFLDYLKKRFQEKTKEKVPVLFILDNICCLLVGSFTEPEFADEMA